MSVLSQAGEEDQCVCTDSTHAFLTTVSLLDSQDTNSGDVITYSCAAPSIDNCLQVYEHHTEGTVCKACPIHSYLFNN